MKTILLIFSLYFFKILSCFSSVVGISTHPMNDQGKILSAEFKGHLSQGHELAVGLRYTQEMDQDKIIDFSFAGGNQNRGLTAGAGIDLEVLREDLQQPRFSFKPHMMYEKFQDQYSSFLGIAPSLRKSFSFMTYEIFPYLSIPSGIKINSNTDEFVYYSSLNLGISAPLAVSGGDKMLFSIEGSKSMGGTSDYVSTLISWVWR